MPCAPHRSFAILLICVCSVSAFAGEAKPRHQQIEQGPFVSYTMEAQWPRQNIVYKGIAIRLQRDGKDRGSLLFDTDLLRTGALWTGGFINFEKDVAAVRDYRAVQPVGTQIAGTPQTPGAGVVGQWTTDGFKDPRTSIFGPVPKTWGRYKGLYVDGDKTVLSYELSGRPVLEMPASEEHGGVEALTRTFTIAPGESSLVFLLSERESTQSGKIENVITIQRGNEVAQAPSEKPIVDIDRVEDNWERLKMGGPWRTDFLNRTKGARIVAIKDPTKPGPMLPPLTKLMDGGGSKRHNDDENTEFLNDKGFFLVDLTAAKDVRQIDTFSWETNVRAPQVYRVYGASGAEWPAITPSPAGAWKVIADVNTEALGAGGMHGASIHRNGAALGNFRWLLFELTPPSKQKEGTLFSEFDVYTTDDAPKYPDTKMKRDERTLIAKISDGDVRELRADERGRVILDVPTSTTARTVKVVFWNGVENEAAKAAEALKTWPQGADLSVHTKGGVRRWKETVETKGRIGSDDKAYAVDTLTMPEINPYSAWFRPGAFDFFSDGTRAAVSNWSGDVWIVSGIDETLQKLTWQRVATGIYNPLGLKIVKDQMYVLGRDQITRLVDLNGDGEIDFYENFNNDSEVTWNFHEFAFDLQTDAAGNFYYAKGGPVRNGGRGFERIAAHHGAILKVSPDGSKLERYATGLRAPNGIAVSPDGQVVTTGENEGTWVPACRLNWVRPGGFSGVVNTAHKDADPKTYDQPLCWLPREMDNSGGGQAWVTSEKWGPFKGDLLHLSYGTCSLYKVMYEDVKGVVQGGVVRFPINFEAGIMRARFSPRDGQLYISGLKGWQTTAARDGCFHRVRFTGKAVNMPTKLSTGPDRITITFTDALLKEDVVADSFSVEQWNYLWSEAYGSADYSVKEPGKKARDTVAVKAATLSADGKTVTLEIPGLQPVMQMKIKLRLTGADGSKLSYDIANSIYAIGGK